MCGEDSPQLLNSVPWSCWWHYPDIEPFWVCIHHTKKHFSHERPCIINRNPCPRVFWPIPWLEKCLCRWLLILVALGTGFHSLLYIFVNPRPPYDAPSQSLHFGYSWVPIMKLVEDFGLTCFGYHDMTAPQCAAILDWELSSTLAERSDLLVLHSVSPSGWNSLLYFFKACAMLCSWDFLISSLFFPSRCSLELKYFFKLLLFKQHSSRQPRQKCLLLETVSGLFG